MAVRVSAECPVFTYTDPANGAGPMWARGGTCLVQCGESLFMSGMETLPVPGKSNCRWTLHQYTNGEWVRVNADPAGYTREPSPLAAMSDGTLWMSCNPIIGQPAVGDLTTRPEILEFDVRNPSAPPRKHLPVWSGTPKWFDHSYRSLAVDAASRELIAFQQFGMDVSYWSFRDMNGQWNPGIVKFPYGHEYEKPQPIRICYPTVALRGRAVHFCGVSSIVEPNTKWRQYKKQLTGQDWDYDFRRLFYCWTPDIRNASFSSWVEVASRETTCGWITPCDMHIASDGRVHLLWVERAIDERLREKFFPGEPQSYELRYAIIRDGAVVHRQTLKRYDESQLGSDLQFARFQSVPGERLFAFWYAREWTNNQRRYIHELAEIMDDGHMASVQKIPMSQVMYDFYSANTRAGSPGSSTLNLVGPSLANRQLISHVAVELG